MTKEHIKEILGAHADRVLSILEEIEKRLALLDARGKSEDKEIRLHLIHVRQATEATVEVCKQARKVLSLYVGLGDGKDAEERFLNERLGGIEQVLAAIDRQARLNIED